VYLTVIRTIVFLLCWVFVGTVQAANVKNVRIWLAPDHSRLVFDLSGPVDHKIFTLQKPDRIVLDIDNSSMSASLAKLALAKSPIANIRKGKNGKQLRVVLDLKRAVRPKSFVLKPNQKYGHRLVVDLYDETVKPVVVKKAVYRKQSPNKVRDIIVSIDAGHGGDDPGAIGAGKVREKDVVLAIARDLKKLFDKTKGYKAVLTRTGDYYISLRGRTKKARKQNADLFVSIHADAFKDPRARGASVWVLSPRGATSEVGRWLARKENSADLIGGVGSGVSLEDKGDVLAGVLLDMSMTASRADSRQVAKNIHKNLASFARMHKPIVEQAGFVVLKSPDIPSILVETGFISNPGEAKKLKTRNYQQKMAKAIHKGITSHFARKPPMMTYVAEKQKIKRANEPQTYRVVRGDTLSVIASRNGIPLKKLREANKLKSDRIRIGQVLRIPSS